MTFDDAEEARLDMAVSELLEVSSLEQLETHMLRHFGTLDIKKMPEGRVKRASSTRGSTDCRGVGRLAECV
jgi:hypothetical protein